MTRRSRYAGPGHVPLWLFLPTLIPVIALSVVPLVQGLWMGFTDYTLGATQTRFIWFENFARMMRDSQFWGSFGVGAIWTLSVTAGVVILGMGLALLLNARLPLQGLARVLVLIPWAIPPIIKGVIWRLVYHPQAGQSCCWRACKTSPTNSSKPRSSMVRPRGRYFGLSPCRC